MDTARLESLSDNIFAVAITLLILDVKIPLSLTHSLGYELWFSQWPHYLGYVVSFVVAGMIWLNHHAIFRLIKTVDYTLIVLNLVLLLLVVFLVYPTSVMAAYLDPHRYTKQLSPHLLLYQKQAAAFYGVMLAAVAASLAVMWAYLARQAALLVPGIPAGEIRRLTRRLVAAPVLFLVATPLALLSLPVGIVIYLVIACAYMFHTGARVTPKTGRIPEVQI